MDCNKDEAIRSRQLAENKMLIKDFSAAQKFAQKARSLSSDLENLDHMLCVCEVHVASELQFGNSEMNWYKILQVDEKADVVTIKKQYRKLALLLHPDKNKFPGAEAAFKLIGEAQRLLADPTKRLLYDAKRKIDLRNFVSNRSTQPTKGPNLGKYTDMKNTFSSQQTKSTFWTACPFCRTRFEYHKTMINRNVFCQTCKQCFLACDINIQGTPSFATFGPKWNQCFSQKTSSSDNVTPRKGPGNFSEKGTKCGTGLNEKTKVMENTNEGLTKESTKQARSQGRKNEIDKTLKPSAVRKRRKVIMSDTESSASTGSTDSEDEVMVEDSISEAQDAGLGRRQSARQKPCVSYNEDLNDDDSDASNIECHEGVEFDNSDEDILKKNEPCDEPGERKNKNNKGPLEDKISKEKGQGVNLEKDSKDVNLDNVHGIPRDENPSTENSNPNLNIDNDLDPVFCEYVEPEFHEFAEDRNETSFKTDQVWAVYDNLDGMPRFYAWIRNVYSPAFKLKFSWLEPAIIGGNPDEQEWCDNELPIACGYFKLGKSQITEDHPMFSHLVSFQKSGRNLFKIYPKEGEIWALYKNWNIKWGANPENHKEYEYEFVKIQSEFAEGIGVKVSYLTKVKGFVSLFEPMIKNGSNVSFQIPFSEMFRFSHRVPSYTMTGIEKEGIPRGSFELDPASLPAKIEEYPSIFCDNSEVNDESTEPSVEDISIKTGNLNNKKESKPDTIKMEHKNKNCAPLHEFHDFTIVRKKEKILTGQTWAIYGEQDKLPRYYAIVNRVQLPEFKIHISWLQSVILSDSDGSLKDPSLTCGLFRVEKTGIQDSTLFSHLVEPDIDPITNYYTILPKKGDIWAVHRGFNPSLKIENMMNCKFDMVEILDCSPSIIEALVLIRLDGYQTVFMAPKKGINTIITLSIPKNEFRIFSHKVPAFRLGEEGGDDLNDYWELDPSAIPHSSFCSYCGEKS